MLSRLADQSLFRGGRQARISTLSSFRPRIPWQWQKQLHLHRISEVYLCKGSPNKSTLFCVPQRPKKKFKQSSVVRCTFITSALTAVPTILLPPVVFVGLLLALWTWKCAMMVLFQDKIIYMPSMPPFARREKVEDYTNADSICLGVKWEEVRIKSQDGVSLTVLLGRIVKGSAPDEKSTDENMDNASASPKEKKDVYIVYFQGNGSSLPPRIPVLSAVLRSVQTRTALQNEESVSVRYTLVALSYRGYWTSSGRASQAGIELDARAVLDYIAATLVPSSPGSDSEIILWGQSIGAGVATMAAASYIAQSSFPQYQNAGEVTFPRITGIVMETPFTSTKNMLIALYPQKWLPYRYLHPFLWNRWDSEVALRGIAAISGTTKPRVLLLPATRDEVVPSEDAGKLEDLCKEVGLDVRRVDVLGALHHEATLRKDGQEAVAGFVVDTVLGSEERGGEG